MRRRTLFGLTLAVALPTVTSDPLREINISTLVGDDPATDIAARIMREANRRLGITGWRPANDHAIAGPSND